MDREENQPGALDQNLDNLDFEVALEKEEAANEFFEKFTQQQFEVDPISGKYEYDMTLDQMLDRGVSEKDKSQGHAATWFRFPLWVWATFEMIGKEWERMALGKVVSIVLKHGVGKIQHNHAKERNEIKKARDSLLISDDNSLLEFGMKKTRGDEQLEDRKAVRVFSWPVKAAMTQAEIIGISPDKYLIACIAASLSSFSKLTNHRHKLCQDEIKNFSQYIRLRHFLMMNAQNLIETDQTNLDALIGETPLQWGHDFSAVETRRQPSRKEFLK